MNTNKIYHNLVFFVFNRFSYAWGNDFSPAATDELDEVYEISLKSHYFIRSVTIQVIETEICYYILPVSAKFIFFHRV